MVSRHEAERIINMITSKRLPLRPEDLATVRAFCASAAEWGTFTSLGGIPDDLRKDWLDESLDPVTRACRHTHVQPDRWRSLLEEQCDRTVERYLEKDGEKKILALLIWRGALAYLPSLAKAGIRACHMEAKRNEHTLEITAPMDLCAKDRSAFLKQDYDAVVIPDPMLASGSSTAFAIDALRKLGVKNEEITVLCAVAAPEGVFHLLHAYQGIRIVAAVLDGRLNENAYIIDQGLGDAGDKYFWGNSLDNFKPWRGMFNDAQWTRLGRLIESANR